MPRIPQADLQQLKNEVSVQSLIEASGVELKKGGKDFTGICPFHADATASLVVTPHKNLWHCFGCQIGGGPIDWVMKLRGVSFRQAVQVLTEEMVGELSSLAAGPKKTTTVRSLTAPVSLEADDRALLAQTVAYYHQRLKDEDSGAAARAYLASRGLNHPGLIDAFQLGVADRTLGLSLPLKNRKDGAAIRTRLQAIGLIRESGHEHFNGSLVIPVFDEQGQVTEVYGRKIRDDLRPGTPKHLYLPGPREPGEPARSRGVFNLAGVQEAGRREPGQREVILCEALIDAMTFWVHGFHNVTSSYGIEGFTDDILQSFKANGIERVLMAYDRDAPGEKAAARLAPLLMAEGFEVLQVLFPPGMDANAFACTMDAPGQALALVVRQAQWLGGVRSVAVVQQAVQVEEQPPAPSFLAAEPVKAAQVPVSEPNQPPAQVNTAQAAIETVAIEVFGAELAEPAEPAALAEVAQLPDEVQINGAACTWRIRAWKRNTTPEAMRVNLQARTLAASALYFMDTLDLYAARSRSAFIKQASIELGVPEDILKRELGTVLLKLEALQDELMTQARRPATPTTPILSADEEAAALDLLRSPDLMARITADLQTLGVVGEAVNLQAAYLAAVSRKLDTPLAILIQSTSAAGKSALMDAVLGLMPEEECLRYSAMTGQSLYYLGEHNLAHKILAIAEEEGVRQAAYALKLLQSEGTLTIASTAKDEQTGNLTTKQYSVRGPVMLMLTTTAIDVDEELLNRCLVLSINESRQQTAAIHARQRHKQTLAGLLQGAQRQAITTLHHNAQRLLASVAVVNPYADRLTFLSDKTRTRRDHMKYLTLIRAIALLHQHQRPIKTITHAGKELAYIEVTKADITLANSIAHEVLGRTLDELPPQTRNLLVLLRAWAQAHCAARALRQSDWRFTRRDLRAHCHWGDTQLKVHLGRLVELEHVLMHRLGLACTYELVYDATDPNDQQAHVNGLLDASTLDDIPSAATHAYDANRSGLDGLQSGSGRPLVGGQSGGGRGGVNGLAGRASIGFEALAPRNGCQTHSSALSSLAAGPVVATH